MKQAAGLLVYRRHGGRIEVLLAHPGGPFWAHKDVWSIPKGELDEGEDHLTALRREFIEELGIEPPEGELIGLGESAGNHKTDHIWAIEADIDLDTVHCDSMVTIEWPPRSGKTISFPENDRYEWKPISEAAAKVFAPQRVFFVRLAEHMGIA